MRFSIKFDPSWTSTLNSETSSIAGNNESVIGVVQSEVIFKVFYRK